MMLVILDLAVYLPLFAAALWLLNLSYTQKKHRWLYVGLSVLLPCVFAGIRPPEIGTDVQVYATRVYTAASSGFSTLMAQYGDMEIGYLLMAYLSTKLFRSFGGLLFATHVLIVLPVTLTIRRSFNRRQALMAGAAFYLVLYCMSLNVMRQSMAAAWMLLGACLWTSKKRVVSVGCLAASMLLHNTAIGGIVMVFVPQMIARVRSRAIRWAWMVLLATVAAALVVNWEQLLTWAFNTIPFLQKYTYYLDIFVSSQGNYLKTIDIARYFDLAWRLGLCLLPLFAGSRMLSAQRRRWFYIAVAGYIVYAVGIFMFNSAYGYRVAIYSDYFLIMLFGSSAFERRAPRRKGSHPVSVNNAAMYALMLIGFVAEYLLLGWHEVSGILPALLRG